MVPFFIINKGFQFFKSSLQTDSHNTTVIRQQI